MNCKALRMFDNRRFIITPATIGYSQQAALGKFLADLWPGVATVLCHSNHMSAHDENGVLWASITYEELPEELADLNLDRVEIEFWQPTGWIEF